MWDVFFCEVGIGGVGILDLFWWWYGELMCSKDSTVCISDVKQELQVYQQKQARKKKHLA
jgi:hypothetical protein